MSTATALAVVIGMGAGAMIVSSYYNLYYGAPDYILVLGGVFTGIFTMMAFGIATYKEKTK